MQELGDDFNDFVCKLDIGVLGYLWCIGENKDKASFLFNVARINRKR